MNPILSVPEYLMLEYAPKFYVGDNEFQMFWQYKYEVDANEVLLALERKNLICEDGIKRSVESATIPEIKNILNENHLVCNGRKSDLVLRLLQELDFETLNIYFPYRYYKLTELGEYHKQTLEFENVLASHRHPDYQVSADEIPLGMTFNDYVWGQLNKRSLYYHHKKQLGLYRNTRHQMAQLLCSEGNYEKALAFYIEVCICDLAGKGYPQNPVEKIPLGMFQTIKKATRKAGIKDINYEIDVLVNAVRFTVAYEKIEDIIEFITQKIIEPFWIPQRNFNLSVQMPDFD